MVMTGNVMSRLESVSYDQNKDQKFTAEVFKVALISAIGGFLFGYDTGIVSGAMIYIKDTIQGRNRPLSYSWQEAIISVTILGAWIFSMIAGSCADKYGRRVVILVSSAVFAVGSVIMGAAPDKWSLLIGRFVVGAGVGLASMVIPTYIAEMSPAHTRGALVTVNTLFITGGQAFAAVTAGVVSMTGIESYKDGSWGWRIMLALAAIPAMIQFIAMIFMPESPRWLMRQGRCKEAREVLEHIRGKSANVSAELASMKTSCLEKNDGNNNNCEEKVPVSSSSVDTRESRKVDKKWILIEVLRDGSLRKALLVGSILQAVQQLTGINTVMYYSATIITMSGVHNKSLAIWLAAITAGVNFLTGFIGIYLVERIGRRLLTLVSLAGVIMSLGILAVAFQIGEISSPQITSVTNEFGNNYTSKLVHHCMTYSSCQGCTSDPSCGYCFKDVVGGHGSCLAGDQSVEFGRSLLDGCSNGTSSMTKQVWAYDWCPSQYSWMTLAGLCLYLFFFGPGMGPMPWTVNSEIFPIWCRGVCYSTTTSFNWFFNFLVSFTFLSLTRAMTKQGAFWLYASFGMAGFIFFYFHLPETKGKSLEETSKLFTPNRSSVLSTVALVDPSETQEKENNAFTPDA